MKYNHVFLTLFLLFSLSLASYAQPGGEQKKEGSDAAASAKRLTVKLFEVKHRDAGSLVNALNLLGSGSAGANLSFNTELRTITVRDYLENVTAIEEGLKRLDVPEAVPVSLEFHLHLIAASMGSGGEKTPFPKAIESVLPQLQATLKYTNYRYINSAIHRVINGGKLEASGVNSSLFPLPAGVVSTQETPAFSQYQASSMQLTTDATGKQSVRIRNFRFGIQIPLRLASNNTQYKDVGLTTELSLSEGELAVVGTANAGVSDEAIIVVISVKKVK